MTFNEKYRRLLKEEESFSDVAIMTHEEYLRIGGMDRIVEFYNRMLPKSRTTEESRRSIYKRPGTVALVAVDEADGEISGLLESYVSEGVRLLATGCVTEKYRNKRLYARMWQIALESIPEDEVKLRFRDSNMKQLHFYESMGFSELTDVGEYRNGETKWEMTLHRS
jgi:ribosomal protein S18 acetylase RimI-like enzyme